MAMKKNQGGSRGYMVRHTAVGIFMAIAAAFFSVSYVRAADANLFLQSYKAEEGQVTVYGANLTSRAENYGPQQFTAMVSGQECPVLEVSTVKQAGEGVTYYCLVDVSGSMHQEQMEKAKGVLTEICGRLGEKDNMVIGTIGTTLETTGFLTDKEEIGKVIEGLSGESDYTAIHDAVTDSISVLQSNNSCNRKKCLVLISDGDDETKLGTTRTEAMDAVTDSRLPVYTVAVMRQSPNEQQKEAAENLGAFARQSVGGKDYPPVGKDASVSPEEFDAKEAGGAIVEDMQNGLMLTFDTSGIEAAKDELLLNVSFKTDTDTYNDTMYLYAADLKSASGESKGQTAGETEEEPTSTQSEETEEEPTSTQSEETETDGGEDGQPVPAAVIIAGAAALLIILALVIFICMRNQAKKEAAKREAAEKEAAEKEAAKREAEEREKARKREEEEKKKAQVQDMTVFRQTPTVPEPYYEVKFTAIDHENIVFVLNIPEEKTVTIGRNKKADLVLNPEDKHLSSVQCRVHCMQNAMNVWDMNSQNGTFVNGVPIRQIGMATVQNNDVIRMGSYEYRINIMKR